ncbi:transporter substrate-binding domain-containing protein [Lutimonas saemankumensis]|uniref:transporter substrate-binding domain-containing protein n=1 Tax=Lutimonas saemankumensis TaxID=483016 RepID=UPI001CD55A4F|nr:transporter substrate-binding domain-containing protein [Lutimonas saemankumensis]MCA0931964.1 transporter substrate-binding domain-containing protein [Lutimonas saemankumensis]
MNRNKKFINKDKILFRMIFVVFLIFLLSCESGEKKLAEQSHNLKQVVSTDLPQIIESGVLKVITSYSPTGYFLYKGKTMGFEYEIFKRLADHLGVRLEMVIAKNVDSVIPMLNRGDGDIIALGYTITSARKEDVSFTDPYLITHQSLIQKKPDNWRKMTKDNIKKSLATDVIDLINDTVSVRKNSSYYLRIKELSNELGDSIYIKVLPGELSDEQIIKMVSEGTIKYSVIDNHKASIHKSYFPNIDISTPISLSQRIAWAVRKTSPELLETINKGLATIKRKPDYNMIYDKYFKNRRQFHKRLDSEFYTGKTGKFSEYDEIVKKYSDGLGWDWILLKSLIYQESMFKSDNTAWTGASGLMQLMPTTAKEMGVTNIYDPEQNIKGGTKYLKRMYSYWDQIPDSIQRIKFAIASYNCGYGHIKDAQKLASVKGKDSLNWDNGVDYYVLNLSKPEFYNDPVVEFGYARGYEPYNYVKDIFDRYKNYKTISSQ